MQENPVPQRFSRNPAIDAISSEVLREAIAAFGLDPGACQVAALSGGFMNANYRISAGERCLVFRFYSTDMNTARREADLLRFLRQTPVRVPEVFAVLEIGPHSVLVREHIAGRTLEDRLLSRDPLDSAVYEDIGQQAAHIHDVVFERAGFLGPSLRIGDEYEVFSTFLLQFIETTARSLHEERLSTDKRERLCRLLQDRWTLALQTEPRRQLVHCDFNPKNILISADDQVSGVIDWEFCLSGNGLIDLGNFFRFDYDYAPDAPAHFQRGYESAGQRLPPGWRDVGRLLDIGNMCSFLERHEDYPETFRTARAVIDATLEHFGY